MRQYIHTPNGCRLWFQPKAFDSNASEKRKLMGLHRRQITILQGNQAIAALSFDLLIDH
jgi:hypothetical protein